MKLIMILAILCWSVMLYADASEVTDNDLPASSMEVETYRLVDGNWVPDGLGPNPACALSRLWKSGSARGECNKKEWTIPVEIHASVAQWIKFTLTGTRWDWRVMKPGTYAGDCIEFELCSNGDVAVVFRGFGDLYSRDACDQTITTWYGYGSSIWEAERNGWVPASELGKLALDEQCPSHCYSAKLWTKIQVDSCNSACEYHDDATIILVLRNQKSWVDDDGSWQDYDVCQR